MAKIDAPRLSIVPVAALPGSPAKGDTVVLASDGHLYTYDGSAWVDNGAAGGGGGPVASGTAIVDFGAGSDLAAVTVSDATIAAGRPIKVWVAPLNGASTDNREEDEQIIEPLRVFAGQIIASTSFVISAICDEGYAYGKFRIAWEHY